MSYLIFDTETSSLARFDLAADHPDQARIVQLGAMLCDGDDFAPVAEMNAIIKPDGWVIGETAQKVHGISLERAMDEGRPIADVIEEFDALADKADVLAGYFVRFDNKLIRGERRRLGRDDRYGVLPELDIMWACKSLCPFKKMPKLEEAYRFLIGREIENAHDALGDVSATHELLIHLHQIGIDIGGKMPKSGRVK